MSIQGKNKWDGGIGDEMDEMEMERCVFVCSEMLHVGSGLGLSHPVNKILYSVSWRAGIGLRRLPLPLGIIFGAS